MTENERTVDGVKTMEVMKRNGIDFNFPANTSSIWVRFEEGSR